MNLTNKTRKLLGDFVPTDKEVVSEETVIAEASKEAMAKKISVICEDISKKLREVQDLYDADETLEQVAPEEFYTLIPKQLDGKVSFLAEGFNRASVAWTKVDVEDEDTL